MLSAVVVFRVKFLVLKNDLNYKKKKIGHDF